MNAIGPPVFEPMSTRLFPKGAGADAYRLHGIAGRCDWVVPSDRCEPHAVLVRRVETHAPRHVFLSMRQPFHALAFFWEQVLPQLHEPFVLVTGSEDTTVPRQLDQRWRPFDVVERARCAAIADDPRLLHWYAENLDVAGHPRMSPLPVGHVFADPPHIPAVRVPMVPPLASRPARILCAHRARTGPQWDLRREVTALARRHPGTCDVVDEELPEDEFLRQVEAHAFVLCASGGGFDPSPKAWQAILHGAIPIVLDGPLRPAYGQLPVAFVSQWDDAAFDPVRLAEWLAALAPRYDDPVLRAESLRRLGIDFWWAQVEAWTQLRTWGRQAA